MSQVLDAINLDEIEEQQLNSLVSLRIKESPNLEYKSELNIASDTEKRELCKDLSALANSQGGYILFGIKEANGDPSSIDGIQYDDTIGTRLRQVITTGISPRMQKIRDKLVLLENGNKVLILKIEPDGYLHQVKYGDNRYHRREGTITITMESADVETFFHRVGQTSKVLELGQQNINLTVIREELYSKEMDLLVKNLNQYKDKYEQFEPHHVDPNHPEEKKQADEFWREIRENKYLAPKELGDIIDNYLKLVDEHERNILKNRTTLSDLLGKRCKMIERSMKHEGYTPSPIAICIKDKLCPLLGEKGLINPMPLDDRLRTEYLNKWREEILHTLDTDPQEELRGPAWSYYDAIYKPEINGPDCLIGPRFDLKDAVGKRYKELEEKTRNIKANLEGKSSFLRH
jgi:hypothetical protein